jgi:hypothetical protein
MKFTINLSQFEGCTGSIPLFLGNCFCDEELEMRTRKECKILYIIKIIRTSVVLVLIMELLSLCVLWHLWKVKCEPEPERVKEK